RRPRRRTPPRGRTRTPPPPSACRPRGRSALRAGARPQSPRRGEGTPRPRSREQRRNVARGQEPGAVAIAAPSLAAVDQRAKAQRNEQEPPRALRLAHAAMLCEEAQQATEILDVEPAAVRGAADVHDLRVGDERDTPARLTEAVRPVRLLAEHEEVLVEEAD